MTRSRSVYDVYERPVPSHNKHVYLGYFLVDDCHKFRYGQYTHIGLGTTSSVVEEQKREMESRL